MNIKDKIIDNLKHNTYCRLKCSKTDGVGVFAIRDIPEQTNPFSDTEFTGDVLITHDEIAELDDSIQELVYDLYYNDEEGVHIQYFSEMGITPNVSYIQYKLNHSDQPNLTWDEDKYCFFTNKKVSKDQELFIDYTKYYV